jgi:hypothetical protein
LNPLTAKWVGLVFTRFADLFGAKVKTRGLEIYCDSEKGIYSEAFRLWCRKLSDLGEDDFKAGMTGVETRAEAMFREGDEMWPPSYAEFRALCFPMTTRDTQAHKYFEPVLALEDKTAKEKRYELGRQKSAELLSMFPDEPEPVIQPSAISLERLEQAKKMLEVNHGC